MTPRSSCSVASSQRVRLAVLVTTRARPLLVARAMRSVERQVRRPDLVVVVDDGRSDAEHAATANALAPTSRVLNTVVLRNRRSPGLAGALNTGLDEIARRLGDAPDVHVATLDDDDWWRRTHLAEVTAAVERGALDLAWTGIVRYGDGHRVRQRVSGDLHFEEVLQTNPGVQGSNLCVRLRKALQAGGFNEHLLSTTDRDFLLRLLLLGGLRRAAIHAHTTVHDVQGARLRLSSPGSEAKAQGLRAFHALWAPWMSPAQLEASRARSQALFQIDPLPAPGPSDADSRALPGEGTLASRQPDEATEPDPGERPTSLVVGITAQSRCADRVKPLLDDLLRLHERVALSELIVLLVENGPDPVRRTRPLRDLARRHAGTSLRVYVVPLGAQRRLAASGAFGLPFRRGRDEASIAESRTVTQAFVYAFLATRLGAIGWVLDDDMRLEALHRCGNGWERKFTNPFPALAKLRAAGADVVIGEVTDSAPLPRSMTVRTQLVDLLHALGKRSAHADTARATLQEEVLAKYPDYHHDLARQGGGHLEVPIDLLGVMRHEGEASDLGGLVSGMERVLAGEGVTRPILAGGAAQVPAKWHDSTTRGGNTFILSSDALSFAPNVSPQLGDRSARRSDMVWAALVRYRGAKRVIAAPIPISQDRRDLVAGPADVRRMVDDVVGYAASRALEECLAKTNNPTGDQERRFLRLARKHLRERSAALLLSWRRTQGLLDSVRSLLEASAFSHLPWRQDPACAPARDRLSRLTAQAAAWYEDGGLSSLLVEVRRAGNHLRGFLRHVETRRHAFQSAMGSARQLLGALQRQRIRWARAALQRTHGTELCPHAVGAGSEGVTFHDGGMAYKVFDGSPDRRARAATALCRIAGGDQTSPHWPSPLAVYRDTGGMILSRPYVDGGAYRGGLGHEFVALLRALRAAGVTAANIKPSNLVVRDGRLLLVDLGEDIIPWTEEDEALACRKAFLTWRFHGHPDLHEMLSRCLRDPAMPELCGWELLHRAVTQPDPMLALREAILVALLEAQPGAVLDYGSGDGWLAKALAARGVACTSYDPYPRNGPVCPHDGSPVLRDRTDVLRRGPFDTVVCSLVLCSVADQPEYDAILKDVLALLTRDGRAVIAVCDPAYAHVRHVGGQIRDHASDFDPDSVTTYAKRAGLTSARRIEAHRPVAVLERDLLRHGLRVVRRSRIESVDEDTFSPAGVFLLLECQPATIHPVVLAIRTCPLEADTVYGQVRHLVGQVEQAAAVSDRVLLLDATATDHLRSYGRPDATAHRRACQRLVREGVVDRLLEIPATDDALRALHLAWTGMAHTATHTRESVPVALTLEALDTCTQPYLLHIDVDCILVRRDPADDFVGRMIADLDRQPESAAISVDIVHSPDVVPGQLPGSTHRVEARATLLHLERLRRSRPWTSPPVGAHAATTWHRLLDRVLRERGLASLRAAHPSTGFIHPPNAAKGTPHFVEVVREAAERGFTPTAQFGRVDLVGGAEDWLGPRRSEAYVFVVCLRNVPPGRIRQCLESMRKQRGPRWGAIVIDDASCAAWHHELRAHLGGLGDRVSLLRNEARLGGLHNLSRAVRSICSNPDSVIVTLDGDDMLLGDDVLERVDALYAQGADLTVGGMVRTDRQPLRDISFVRPWDCRGGNVWQHLRTFRKRLFDAVPDDLLRGHDGHYHEFAADWAYMLPMCNLASRPMQLGGPAYLHEPSGQGKAAERTAREAAIKDICDRTRAWANMGLPPDASARSKGEAPGPGSAVLHRTGSTTPVAASAVRYDVSGGGLRHD